MAASVPTRVYEHPRVTLLYVAARTWRRLLEIQVWDVAAAMTFFALLALLPSLVAVLALVSLVGLQEESAATAARLAAEVWPSLDPGAVRAWILAQGSSGTGTAGVVLGAAGAVVSASGGVAAFHRAMDRIQDTREGRSLLRFRTVVVLETLALLLGLVLVLALVLLGGDLAVRLGRALELDRAVVRAWDLATWPLLLVVIILVVTLGYHRGPNVRPPRYRPVTSGAVAVVVLLYAAALALGWITDRFGAWAVVGRINSALGVLGLAWLAGIVVIAGAAWDAEVLRARQLAAGLPAEDEIQLAPRHTEVLQALDAADGRDRSLGVLVRTAARDGGPVEGPRTRLLTERGSFWAVDAGRRSAAELTSGRPFHGAPARLPGERGDAAG